MHFPSDVTRALFMLWLIPLMIVVLFCAGCAIAPTVPPVLPPLRPNTDLLQVCDEPSGSASTNGTIAAWLLAYKQALRECNNQITTFKETP